ncbi:HNH endonuclease signature motif containing protein [Saccharopolyspora antimicrobica]|uniref:HNH endonuclease n=1 Tax=Saccharopolyspora antimicrobica TaxID=455193 RepID=A0ABX9TKE0_9PSEU|nr:HNH endonuclease signature motif containing protein [Saccharopolyspora antimicrobica]RKT87534.1 HNH endonuclease [Saccharopolyspora antimicrobica]
MTPLMTTQDATPAAGAGAVVPAWPAWDAPTPGGSWPPAVTSLSDAELATRIGEVERQIRQARMQQLRLIAEADRRRLHAARGVRSTQVWLKNLLNIDGQDATNRVRIATATTAPNTGEATESTTDVAAGVAGPEVALPATGEALAEGVIGLEHARVISRCVSRLPEHAQHRAGEVERLLVENACRQCPRDLAKLADRVRYMLDADGAVADEQAQFESRELHYATARDGMLVIKARLDRETGAKFVTALRPLAAPRPETDGIKDPRTVGQRNADGLSTLLDLVLDTDGMPRTGGQKPHLTVTIDYTDLKNQLPTTATTGTSGEIITAAGGGAGMLEGTGQYLSPHTIRRIACDCEVLPMVLGGDSLPLDVGASQRTAPTHIRAALLARDGVCAFPECDHPAGTPQAHHIVHWVDGGPTSVENMVMLCAHHHRTIHNHHWHIQLDHGRPVFTPPANVDPARTPRSGGKAQPATHRHALRRLNTSPESGPPEAPPLART